MAKKIQAWAAFGPKITLGDPVTAQDIIENIVAATNQSKGSVLAVLSELDVQLEAGLKAGRIVQLPNGTHFEPIGKKDGSVNIGVRAKGAELIGEVVQYEDMYKLCYMRGPAGIIVALAEELS